MATVNVESISKMVISRAESMSNFMRKAAEVRFDAAQEKLLEEFDSHPITQEIKAGPKNEANQSETLGGMPNLFSFIGFEAGSDPILPLRRLFSNDTRILAKDPEITATKRKITFAFEVAVPNTRTIASATPLPFNSEKSWALSIEDGLWGLSHYIFGLLLRKPKVFKQSRSGPGLESKHQIREEEFEPQPYLTPLLETFEERLLGK